MQSSVQHAPFLCEVNEYPQYNICQKYHPSIPSINTLILVFNGRGHIMSEIPYRTFAGFLILLGCLGMTFAVHASGKKMFNLFVWEQVTD